MTSDLKRPQIYSIVKRLTTENNIEPQLRWPSGNAQQWRDELSRVRNIITLPFPRERRPTLLPPLPTGPRPQEIARRQAQEQLLQDIQREIARRELAKQKKAEAKRQNKITNDLINEGKFNEILDRLVNENITLSNRQAGQMWDKILNAGQHTLTITDKDQRSQNVAMNSTTAKYINDLLTKGLSFTREADYGSDIIDSYDFPNISKLTITFIPKPERKIKNKDGAFFPYINTTKIDLSPYQIYTQDQADEIEQEKREHCLIHALNKSGVKKSLINAVKLMLSGGAAIPKKYLKTIANAINRNITLHSIKPDGRPRTQKYLAGNPKGHNIDIAIYEGHYFHYDKTDISNFVINNYDSIKEISDFKNIDKKKNKKYEKTRKIRGLDSLRAVHKMFQEGMFKKKNLISFPESGKHIALKNHIYLDNIENEQQLLVPSEPSEEKKKRIFYADTETYVKNTEYHQLQLLGYVGDNNDLVRIMNEKNFKTPGELVDKFLNEITRCGKDDVIVYFHNLKYDYFVLEKYLNIKSRCEKDGSIYSVKINHRGKLVEFRDSYKLLPFALSKFQSNFSLPDEFNKKEAIAYTYYTKENNGQRTSVETYKALLTIQEKKILEKNLRSEPTYDEKTRTFNPMEYYQEYLRLDCLVLKKGLEKFNQIIKEVTGLDIYKTLTISSLADKYFRKEGCYEDVYEMTGNLREYVGKAIYGGRVHVNQKYAKQVIEGKISDYDGVSLYPSAINRLCREYGLPLGKAKRLINKQWQDLDYAIMTVKINAVNKKQQMPFIAHKTDTSINYLNEAPEEPVIIDKYTLEDYIKFHDIEYEILDGVYWDQGFNKKMGGLIQNLFNTRLKYKMLAAKGKSPNKALANVIKLMLNSTYGKTIMKPTYTRKVIINGKRFKNYLYNNFNTITKYRQLSEDIYEIERTQVDESYNRAHIGCAILSFSKRIMNEVFDIANTHSLPIYYTDTDSLHCNLEDIPTLETEYEKTYNKQLTGKQLEQFHTDFDLEGAATEIYATKSIFLGKKSYFDLLESKNKNGDTIHGHHLRLKGITKEGLLHASKSYDRGYFELYKDLASGTEKNIILNPYNPDTNHQKVLFDFKDGKVMTKKEFVRTVKF